MSLGDYTIFYSGGIGTAPSSRTFAQLGVTAAKFVSADGGQDYADITVDVSVASQGMPFVPLARHAIYDGGGTLRFVGWLMQPERAASPARQQQTFHLEGPMSRLATKVFMQAWNYAVDPTNFSSDLHPLLIPRVVLNREDYATGQRVNLAEQIQAVLDYYIGLFGGAGLPAPIAYGNLAAIPALQPPEDEQTDIYCDGALKRLLRWAPKVTAYWTYPNVQPVCPVLNFSANDAVSADAIVGNVAIVPGGGLIPLAGYSSVLIDPTSGTLASFKSTPRYDQLIGKVTVFSQAEVEVTDDGSATGTRKLWATLSSDVSTADNGSDKELTYCYDLRGESVRRDPATGLPTTPQETLPTGLAAAFHEPFKVLTHSLEWSVVGADVDWATPVGAAVGVRNGGSDLLLGSRSIIRQITRDIGSGTTTYQAGPPMTPGIGDVLALTRLNRVRNAGRNGGGGYSSDGGPDQQDSGEKPVPNQGGSGGGVTPSAPVLNDFALYNASSKHRAAGGLWVGIKYGNVTPNGGNLAAGVNPWPSQFTDTTSPPNTYEFAVSSSGLAWLAVTVNPDPAGDHSQPFSVTSDSVGWGTVLPTNTDDTGYQTLGAWSVTSPAGVPTLAIANSNGIGSLSYGYCGGAHYFDSFIGSSGQT